MTTKAAKHRLIILASTYPRWAHDHEPSFVHELARRLTSHFDVVAVVPHAKGAKRSEYLDGVRVDRYRYAPDAFETLVNDGGIVTNLQRAPWKFLLVPTFVFMQYLAARRHVQAGSVVHAHWIVPQGLIARLLGRPYLVTSHGADLFALKGKGAMAAKRAALGAADCLTVVSEAMLAPARQLRPSGDVLVRSMGVDMRALFTPGDGATRGVNQLLFVGRLVEKKGLDVLIRALPSVLEQHAGAHLTVVGHGPLRDDMRDLAARLGVASRVDFVGPIPQRDLPDVYRKASLFVAPFRETRSGDREGLGLVLVEALACGCPVVASDIPSTRDVLSDVPGVRTVQPDDVASLAQVIIEALNDEATAFREAASARPRLIDRFDWEAVAASYVELLENVRRGTSVPSN